jgi:hypothetical protein
MNKSLLLICFFYIVFIEVQSLQASEKSFVIRANQELPIETNLVLEELQKSPLPRSDFDSLKHQVSRIDIDAQLLTKEEVFFIIKSIFYKTLLVSTKQINKYTFDTQSFKNLSEASINTNNSFLKWFFMALSKDAQLILQLPLYHDYLVSKNLGKIENIELRKIDKKVQLISSWVTKFTTDSPDLLLKEIDPILQDILNKIEIDFHLLATLSKSTSITPQKTDSPLKFFSIEEVTKSVAPTTPPKQEKSVEDIIDSTDALPTPSNEDWLLN